MIHHVWRIRVSWVGVERGRTSLFRIFCLFCLVVLPFRLFCLLFPLFSFLCSSSSPCQPQLGNLLQVNRTLGRNVPLASQLILMPNGAVAAVQQEVPSAQSPGVHADADQVSGSIDLLRALGRRKGLPQIRAPFHLVTIFQNSCFLLFCL